MKTYKFATICLIGLPNVGKSTLLNQLLGHKISIVTHKIHTTRDNIRGFLSEENTQLVFIDTPGFLHRPQRVLEKNIAKKALKEIRCVTFVCILIDPNKKDCLSNFLLNKDLYLGSPNPPLIILNKVDLLRDKKDLLPLLEKLQTLGFFCVYLISAAKNKGVSDLKKYFFKNAPLGDWLYEKERITDRSSQLLAEDMTREQLYQFLHEEIPYSLAVQTESWRETEQSLVLHQTILLTRRNQKSIVLGPGGELLKKIGTLARISISRLINKKTHLYLHIKVKPKKFL